MLCGWIVDQDQSPMEEEKSHLERRVLSSQASLYRLLWGEYHVHRPLFTGCFGESTMFKGLSLQVALGRVHVHRPLFTGCPRGLGIQGKCQVYQSLFTDPPLQVPSLPIPPYRQMAKKYVYSV
jgi:hypothetical protein